MTENETKRTHKICANRMKKTPTRTFVASGCSVGSEVGKSADRMRVWKMPSASSLRVSLIKDPLSPTRETPAITVNSEIHLSKTAKVCRSIRKICAI